MPWPGRSPHSWKASSRRSSRANSKRWRPVPYPPASPWPSTSRHGQQRASPRPRPRRSLGLPLIYPSRRRSGATSSGCFRRCYAAPLRLPACCTPTVTRGRRCGSCPASSTVRRGLSPGAPPQETGSARSRWARRWAAQRPARWATHAAATPSCAVTHAASRSPGADVLVTAAVAGGMARPASRSGAIGLPGVAVVTGARACIPGGPMVCQVPRSGVPRSATASWAREVVYQARGPASSESSPRSGSPPSGTPAAGSARGE